MKGYRTLLGISGQPKYRDRDVNRLPISEESQRLAGFNEGISDDDSISVSESPRDNREFNPFSFFMRPYTGLIALETDDAEKIITVITRYLARYDLTSYKMTEQLKTSHRAKYPEESSELNHIEIMQKRLN